MCWTLKLWFWTEIKFKVKLTLCLVHIIFETLHNSFLSKQMLRLTRTHCLIISHWFMHWNAATYDNWLKSSMKWIAYNVLMYVPMYILVEFQSVFCLGFLDHREGFNYAIQKLFTRQRQPVWWKNELRF